MESVTSWANINCIMKTQIKQTRCIQEIIERNNFIPCDRLSTKFIMLGRNCIKIIKIENKKSSFCDSSDSCLTVDSWRSSFYDMDNAQGGKPRAEDRYWWCTSDIRENTSLILLIPLRDQFNSCVLFEIKYIAHTEITSSMHLGSSFVFGFINWLTDIYHCNIYKIELWLIEVRLIWLPCDCD